MALTEYDKKNLSAADQKKIQDATDKWNAANAKGDKAGMAAAAAEASAVRNKAGYQTDSSGNYSGAYSPTTSSSSSGGGSNKNSQYSYGYTIGSDYGKQQAQNMGIGSHWTATDGSVWTKENDGTITVDYNGQKYSNAYKPSDLGILGIQQMDAGVGWRDVLSTYQSRQNKALNTEGLEDYANDEIQQQMWQYILDGMQNENKPEKWVDYDQTNPRPDVPESDPRIEKWLNEILNRDDFSYDAAKDPLYQQYAQMYQREGDRAMRDTMAEAAAAAGGMNSYAMTAASQANNYYTSQLADKVPELYELAYQMYLNDLDLKVQDLGLLQNMDATQYNRYRDTLNDWKSDRQFALDKYQTDLSQGNWQTSFDYNAMVNDRDFTYNDYWQNKEYDTEEAWRNKEFNANQSQIELENSRYEQEKAQEDVKWYISMGLTPPADVVKKSGIPQETVNKMLANALAGGTSSSNGSSSRRRSSSSSKGSYGGNDFSSYTVTNKNGESWIEVTGYGRLSYQDLQRGIENGNILATQNNNKKTITYKKA